MLPFSGPHLALLLVLGRWRHTTLSTCRASWMPESLQTADYKTDSRLRLTIYLWLPFYRMTTRPYGALVSCSLAIVQTFWLAVFAVSTCLYNFTTPSVSGSSFGLSTHAPASVWLLRYILFEKSLIDGSVKDQYTTIVLVWFYGISNIAGYLTASAVFTYLLSIRFVNLFRR